MCAFLPSGDEKESADISGNTLRIYFYLLSKRQSCGVREIQKAFGFSSSSTAHYHLEKLANRGILTKDSYGNYKINKNKKVGLLNPFLVVRGFMFPKQLIYAISTTIMCLLFLAFFWNPFTLTVVFALLPGIVASGIFWYETAKLWSSLPSFKKERSTALEERSNA